MTALAPPFLRPAVVSGSFYSADPKKLAANIRKKITAARTGVKSSGLTAAPFAYLVPHAGHDYSGQTAAAAYRILKAHPVSTVILLGPSHHVFVEGSCVHPAGAFATPLGPVPVHEEITAGLIKKEGMTLNNEAHLAEHSLEVQLPFLQTVLPEGFRIVPILTGENSLSHIERLAGYLLEVFDAFRNETFAVVASTDLSRFHPAEAAERIDSRFLSLLAGFKLKELIEELNANRIEACGSGPVLTALLLARTLDKSRFTLLDRSDSSAVSRDTKRVVGYFSAILS